MFKILQVCLQQEKRGPHYRLFSWPVSTWVARGWPWSMPIKGHVGMTRGLWENALGGLEGHRVIRTQALMFSLPRQ